MTDMITQSQPIVELKPWQLELRDAIRDSRDLLKILALDDLALAHKTILGQFPCRVPRGFVARMRKGDPNDPLLRQILPISAENVQGEGFQADPLNEQAYNQQTGLIQKYHGRVLLTLSSVCAVNCRYCFRRHFPYAKNLPNPAELTRILNFIQNDQSIKEVIFSGGDPLLLTDARLTELGHAISHISHVHTLRFHTRVPIVLPSRIDDGFMAMLNSINLRKVMVVHANHAHEFDGAVSLAMQRLRENSVTLLNQAVLLKGINDNAQALIDLSTACHDVGILPYYLHLMDKVAHASHFEVDLASAKQLMQELAGQLPGYLVPRLSREVPGMGYKEIIGY